MPRMTIAQAMAVRDDYKSDAKLWENRYLYATRELSVRLEELRLVTDDRDQQKRERDQFFVAAQRAETQRDEFDRQAERWRVKYEEESVKRHRAEGAVAALREILDRRMP
jgi:hypothetical protein